MNGLADAAMARIRGMQDAQQAIYKIRRGYGQGQAISDALQAVIESQDANRLGGFCREIEKAVEQRVSSPDVVAAPAPGQD